MKQTGQSTKMCPCRYEASERWRAGQTAATTVSPLHAALTVKTQQPQKHPEKLKCWFSCCVPSVSRRTSLQDSSLSCSLKFFIFMFFIDHHHLITGLWVLGGSRVRGWIFRCGLGWLRPVSGGGALLGSGRFLGTWSPEIRIWVCTDVTP